jgi:hypothetical protein
MQKIIGKPNRSILFKTGEGISKLLSLTISRLQSFFKHDQKEIIFSFESGSVSHFHTIHSSLTECIIRILDPRGEVFLFGPESYRNIVRNELLAAAFSGIF